MRADVEPVGLSDGTGTDLVREAPRADRAPRAARQDAMDTESGDLGCSSLDDLHVAHDGRIEIGCRRCVIRGYRTAHRRCSTRASRRTRLTTNVGAPWPL